MTEAVVIESTDEDVPANSRKREIAATVVTVGLTIALGMAANVLIEKFTDRVKNKIAPKDDETE